ncbi:MAG: hypothetical protein HRU15_00845 [Planctomycetes bacterium]|nr:hypothetical protein [Planctomycetota bacterium]
MNIKILSICLLTCATAFSLCAAENGGRGRGGLGGMGNMGGMMNRLMGNTQSDFDRLSDSEKSEDLEEAALSAMDEEIKAAMNTLRLQIQMDDAAVQAAYKNAIAAQIDFLKACEGNEAITALGEERTEIDQAMKSGDWQKIREQWQRRSEISLEVRALLENDLELKEFRNKRIDADSAFTKVLRAALDANSDYADLQGRSDRLQEIRRYINDEKAQERQQRGNRGQKNGDKDAAKDDAKKAEQNKKPESVQDF